MISNRSVALYISIYGLFLFFCGSVGFLLTHQESTSALVNGAVGGLVMVVLGILHRQGRTFTLPAALGATGIFTVTFVWRSALQWMAVAQGSAEHLPLAVLLSVMMLSSVVLCVILWKLWYR